jgi:ABC-2 type transport system permease protein
MIRAILSAQFRSMRMLRTGSPRRAVFSLLVAVLWYGFWTLVAASVYGLISSAPPADLRDVWLPAGLGLIVLYWQVAPMATASFGASLDLRKLLVYPVPRRKLFAVEVLLRLSTSGEMLLVLAGGAAGLLANSALGGWRAAPRVALAALLFTAFNLLLASGLRSLIERALSRKRAREAVILLLVFATALPRFLMSRGTRFETFEKFFAPAVYGAWPWRAAAEVAAGEAAAGVPVLVLWCVAALWFGRWQFERSLRFDAQAARATSAAPPGRTASWSGRFFRLPGLFLPDPLAAIVEKELRSLARTPRFRTVFIMGFTFGLLVWLPLIMGRGQARNSAVAENFLAIVSLYAFTLLGQVSYWNSFGFDRAAAQGWFLYPAPLWLTIAGKNLAAALYILLEVSAVTAACVAISVPIAPVRVVEAFIVTPVAALFMLALGNLSSVHFPRPMAAERVSQGGSANRFQGLLFVLYPVALLPVVLAYLARWALASMFAFYAVLAFAAVLGAAVYWIAMDSAVRAARTRREALISELSGGEGPVISD